MTCYNSIQADKYAHQLGLEAGREMAVDSLCVNLYKEYLQDSSDNLGISEDAHLHFSESIVDEHDIPRKLVKALEENNDEELLQIAKMMATMSREYVNEKLYEKALNEIDNGEEL